MANSSDNKEQSIHYPACAACKHQRKGCRPNCILRRHFPADRAKDFEAVQKIFGVKSLKKMMSEVNPDERDEVGKSMYWEAAMWAQDPVRGPYGCFNRVRDELNEYIYKEEQQSLQHFNMMRDNNNSFDGNMMMNGSSIMDMNNTTYARSGSDLHYPYPAAIDQRFMLNQEAGRNTASLYSPRVRVPIDNGLNTTDQSISSNGQGSRGQVNIEGFGSGSNGTNQALNQGLHEQHHYINSQRHSNSLPDAREESREES